MKQQTFSVLFFIRKTRLLKSGETPINMRITVGGRYVEMQTMRRVLPANWNQRKERATGKCPSCVEINYYLDSLKSRVFEIHKELVSNNVPVDPIVLKEKIQNKQPEYKLFFQIFKEHNDQMEKLLNIDYERSTLGRYRTCLSYFREMYREEYSQAEDFPVKHLNADMIHKFEIFLKTKKRIANNTMIRFMKCVKKIVNMAFANGWIQANPFVAIHYQSDPVIPTFITEEELTIIQNKEICIPRLEIVRDIYVFCCFTVVALTQNLLYINELERRKTKLVTI